MVCVDPLGSNGVGLRVVRPNGALGVFGNASGVTERVVFENREGPSGKLHRSTEVRVIIAIRSETIVGRDKSNNGTEIRKPRPWAVGRKEIELVGELVVAVTVARGRERHHERPIPLRLEQTVLAEFIEFSSNVSNTRAICVLRKDIACGAVT